MTLFALKSCLYEVNEVKSLFRCLREDKWKIKVSIPTKGRHEFKSTEDMILMKWWKLHFNVYINEVFVCVPFLMLLSLE